MKLHDAHTRDFMPEWALPAAWLCDGLDPILNECNGRINALPAPLTLASCEALTDEELKDFYAEQGLAAYYPDLSHYDRARLLYLQNGLWRYLGTPRAVEVMCEYLFDGVTFRLDIRDNLAFDDEGHLIDEDALDVFDAELSIEQAYLPEFMLWRVLANIRKFTRNTQWMRAFSFLFELDHVPVSVTPTDGGIYAVDYECNCGEVDPYLYKINHNMRPTNGEAQSYAVDMAISVEE